MSAQPLVTPLPSLSSERYESTRGRVYLSGVQALVRLPMDQMRSDAHAGLRARGFITGYPGSPLGGYDLALAQAAAPLAQLGITHVPGQNEELAASALIGTQMLDIHPHPDVDGVVGYWYGKGPGVDRSSDAFKHGNFAGTSTHGAVVILSGEDHEAKSSSVPYQQEFAFEHYGVPVLYPASVSEFISYGLHAAALSRYCGCWVAMKLVASLCDGGEVIDLGSVAPDIVLPRLELGGKPFSKRTNFKFFPVLNVETERQLYEERHVAAVEYARINQLNRLVVSSTQDRIGIITAGKSYSDTRQALIDLGLDEAALSRHGIRVAKVGMLCPGDDRFMQEFARGLERIIVIEEKRDFLERQVGRAACGLGPIAISGKRSSSGEVLFPVAGGMDADRVAELLARELQPALDLPSRGRERLRTLLEARQVPAPALARRTPNYCSGCPHNVSTKLAPGQVAWGAPGCHVFAALMEQPERQIEALTQFGGEGMPWIGLSPYTSTSHMIQNVGDGSLFHSSYQNIRFAVASGVNMTFRILFNGAVANTGGQSPVGKADIPGLLHKLAIDGVVRTVLIARDPHAYAHRTLPPNTVIRPAHELQSSLLELSNTRGVTVLLYDGECANERRRKQKRGKLPTATVFTVVNEDACENCGDCGAKANCMSLQKVDTEWGTKTQIHQSSCNQDRSCLEGECPSFVTVTVEPGTGLAKRPMPDIRDDLPLPALPTLERPYHIYVPGVGGTGVITANAILAQAAALDGRDVKSFDQTGAAQKWGPVLSSLIIAAPGATPYSNKVGIAQADLYLALDSMAATDRSNLNACNAEVTVAVINSDQLPNGESIRNVYKLVRPQEFVAAIGDRTRAQRNVVIPARTIAEQLFGDYMMANMVAIGAAFQAGLLPISAGSIEKAIELNGAQTRANIMAFRAGRLTQSDPSRLAALSKPPYTLLADRMQTMRHRRSARNKGRVERLLQVAARMGPASRALAEPRVEDLIAYQSESYAHHYVERIAAFCEREKSLLPGNAERLTQIVIRNLHKVMAYKDEYETARLLLDPTFATRVRQMFPGFKTMHFNLQPPLLRGVGWRRKMAVGAWARPLLRLLSLLKFVRGGLLDPFASAHARQVERSLIGWYEGLMELCQARLEPRNSGIAQELLSLPEQIRGYEHLKIESAARAQELARALGEQMRDTTGSRIALKAVS